MIKNNRKELEDRRKQLMQHFKKTRKIVKEWPDWKKELIGSTRPKMDE